MADVKTIGISTLITIGLIVASFVGTSYFDNPKYYCEAKQSIMECPGGLSGGLGSRCYLNSEKTSWNTCTAGWIKITNDISIQENETIIEPIIEPEIPAYQGFRVYDCDQTKCIKRN
jgi:hypothetical protein